MSRDGLGLRPMAELMAKLTEKLVVIQDKRLEVVAIAWPSNSFPVDEQSLFAALSDQDNLPAVLRNRKGGSQIITQPLATVDFPQPRYCATGHTYYLRRPRSRLSLNHWPSRRT